MLFRSIPAIMRVSRTVQWMREAAQRDTTFVRRALEETALTTIYLATFAYWMQDDSENSQNTREFLAHKLKMAESLDHWVYRSPDKETATAATETQSHKITATFESSPLTEPITQQKHEKSG